MAAATVVRPLDPAERYFWLLGRLSPVNVVAVAELDRLIGDQALRRALDRVQQRHRLLRVRIAAGDSGLAFLDTTARIPLATAEAGTPWTAVLQRELDRPFDTEAAPGVRCVMVPAGDGTTVLLLAAHHAVADGIGVVRATQELVRTVAGVALPATVDDPPGVHDRFPATLTAPRAVVTVASAIRAERAGQEPPAALAFHHRHDGARRSRVQRLVLGRGAVRALHEAARAEGATVHGALAAAMLQAVAPRPDGAGGAVVCLATPTDLRRRVVPPLAADTVMLAVGMLCTPYPVTAGSGLARMVTEQTHREADRGESHLFYRFARAAGYPATDEGVASFGTAFASAPQNVAVSNLGVLDHGGDPAWVRSIGFALGTSGNQPAFLAATTYRGRLVLHLTSDQARLQAGAADAIVAALEDRLLDGQARRRAQDQARGGAAGSSG